MSSASFWGSIMPIFPRVVCAVAPLALVVLLGAGEAQAQRGLDRLEGRSRDAADMCLQRADELVRDRERGRGGAEIAQVVRADEDDDKVELEAYLNVYARDNDRREAFLTCTVDFEGENRITDFDEDGLLRSINYYRDRSDDRNRDRPRRRDGDEGNNARAACRELFEEQGYRVSDVRDRDRNGDQVRLEMRVERNNGRRFDAVCLYNRNRDEARFAELRPVDRGNRR
jgi:hypothetical protein